LLPTDLYAQTPADERKKLNPRQNLSPDLITPAGKQSVKKVKEEKASSSAFV
jgi:hypothetical protein